MVEIDVGQMLTRPQDENENEDEDENENENEIENEIENENENENENLKRECGAAICYRRVARPNDYLLIARARR